MPPKTVEERLTELELKVAQLLGEKPTEAESVEPEALPAWLRQLVGAFKDDPDFDAAMERGAEYRRSQPTAADEWDAIEAERTHEIKSDASA
jgi:hypothetical protein